MRCTIVVVAAVAIAPALAACGGDDEPAQRQANLIAGSFVGKATPSTHAFVAIEAAQARGDAQARDVRAYLCDPRRGINEWFRGSVRGNRATLRSQTGATIQANLADQGATGTVTLKNGQSLSFTTKRASGLSGLYTVNISRSGAFTGASVAGGRVEGQVHLDRTGSEHVKGGRPVSVTLTAPDGQRRSLDVGVSTFRTGGADSFEGVFIVSGRHLVGGTKQGKSGTSYVDPACII